MARVTCNKMTSIEVAGWDSEFVHISSDQIDMTLNLEEAVALCDAIVDGIQQKLEADDGKA